MGARERLVTSEVALAMSATEFFPANLLAAEFVAAARHLLVHSSAVTRVFDADVTGRAFSVMALLFAVVEAAVEKFSANFVTS